MFSDNLYHKTVNCPVCHTTFKTTQPKANRARVVSRDPDFCQHFTDDVNPYYYAIICCPTCGHTSTEKEFNTLTNAQTKAVVDNISWRWGGLDYTQEKTATDSINLFKLAYNEGLVTKKSDLYLGLLVLKMCWIFRQLEDVENELKYLMFVITHLEKAYAKDTFEGDFSLTKCTYIIAETHRRLGNTEKALEWYERGFDHSKHNDTIMTKTILERRRELISLKVVNTPA